jgi:hypothetical protein
MPVTATACCALADPRPAYRARTCSEDSPAFRRDQERHLTLL